MFVQFFNYRNFVWFEPGELLFPHLLGILQNDDFDIFQEGCFQNKLDNNLFSQGAIFGHDLIEN